LSLHLGVVIYVSLVRAASIGLFSFKLPLLEASGHHLPRYEYGAILLLLSMWTSLFLFIVAILLMLTHVLSGALTILELLVLLLPERSLSNLPLSLVSGKLLGMLGFQEGLKVVLTELALNLLWCNLREVKLFLLRALLELVVGCSVSGGRAVQDQGVADLLKLGLLMLV